jgi:hypothetical protein
MCHYCHWIVYATSQTSKYDGLLLVAHLPTLKITRYLFIHNREADGMDAEREGPRTALSFKEANAGSGLRAGLRNAVWSGGMCDLGSSFGDPLE